MSISVEDALSSAGDSIEAAATLLWKLDHNRLRPTIDYRLDVQSRTEAYSHDAASQPLVAYISDQVWSRPTYALFKKLLNNYTAETGVPEVVSEEERSEEDHFLAAICETPCIQFVYRWLIENAGLNCASIDDFSDMLKEMWFYHYNRDASRDSSGFEHVFCGEIDEGKVKGMHNFFQILTEESRQHFDYKGYLDIRGEPCAEPPPANQQLITIRFEWLGETKPCSSMFVGVSPEFEFALYTLIYVAGREELEVELGAYTARIKVYQMAGKIGTAFPELLGVDLDKLAEEAQSTQGTEQEVPGMYSGSGEAVPQSGFPPLGSPSKPVSEGLSYANAVLGEDAGETEEVECANGDQEEYVGGEEATGDVDQPEGEAELKANAMKIFKFVKILAKLFHKFKQNKGS